MHGHIQPLAQLIQGGLVGVTLASHNSLLYVCKPDVQDRCIKVFGTDKRTHPEVSCHKRLLSLLLFDQRLRCPASLENLQQILAILNII